MAIERENLVVKPNFEGATTAWTKRSGGAGTVEPSTAHPRHGTKCLKVTTVGTANEGAECPATSFVPVLEASKKYTASIYIYAGEAAVGKVVNGIFQELSSAGAFVGNQFPAGVTLVAGWNRISGTFTSAATAAKLGAIVYVGAVAVTFEVDDLLVEYGATLGEWFDGSNAPAEKKTGWTGTANESTSYLEPIPEPEPTPPSPIVAARVTSEPVDDTLFVKLTTAAGGNNRLSGIEDEASKIATGITTSNSAPGGHRSGGLALLRDPRRSWPDLNFIDDVVIYGRTKPLGRNVFEGMAEQFPSQVTDTSSIAINAVGNQALLSENEAWKALYVDLGFGNWQEARLGRKKFLAEAGIPQGKISLSTGDDGLVWTVPSQALAALEDTEASYQSKAGCLIGAVGYKGTRVKNWGSFKSPLLFLGENETLAPGNGSIALTLDGSARVVDVATATIAGSTGTAWRYAMLYAQTAAAVTPEAGTQQSFSALAVYGATGVQRREIPGQLPGVYGHDVFAHIVSTGAPDLNFTVGGSGSIVPNTSFVVPDFAPTDPGKPSDAIEKLNAYFLNNWGVWDNKEAFWKPWDPEGVNWQISIAGGAQWTPVGRQAVTLLNGIVVSYTDAEGLSRTAGPPGSGCDFESPYLVNPDPMNPYTRRGRRRWGTLSVGFPLAYPTTAFQVGSIVLAESMMPQRSGSLTIRPLGPGHIPSITHPTMGQLPVWAMRSGDYATLMDWPVPEGLRVTQVDYTHDTKTLTAQLDSGAARLTAILERTGSSLTV